MKNLLVIAGLPRSGTTFLYLYLKKHPAICAAAIKEINYFSIYYKKGIDWFESLFDDCGSDRWAMDVSPMYVLNSEYMERIATSKYRSKVIVGVRHPEEWLKSFYKQVSNHQISKLDWNDFQIGHLWNIEGSKLPLDFSDGFFEEKIESCRKSIPKNLLLFDYRLLDKDPLRLLQEIENFLEIEPYFTENNFENRIVNASVRNNNKWLTVIMNQGWIKTLLFSVIPDGILDKMRDGALEKSSQKDKIVQTDAVELKVSPNKESDVKYYHNLFENQDLVRN
jgi:hypothetical protein